MSSAAAAAAIGAFCAVLALADIARAHASAPRPQGGPSARSSAGIGRRGVRRTRGGWVLALLVGLGRRAGVPAAPSDLSRRIAAAGLDPRLRAADVMAVKGGAALAALVTVAPFALGLPGLSGVTLAVTVAAAAFLAPDAWLRRRARTRARRMAVEAADLLDLLRVAVAAGMPVARALDDVGRRHPGLLAAELRRAGREIAVGVPSEQALAGLVSRCDLPVVTALVAAMDRAARHGSPLAPVLVALAADARADRVRALADHAARAAPKIQLVIALLLVPGVLLLVAAALMAALTG